MSAAEGQSVAEAVQAYITHHTQENPHEWALPFVRIPLPSFLSLHALMLLLCGAFLVLIFGRLYKKTDGAPTALANALESFILYIRDQIAVPNIGEKDGRNMTPLLCTLFFFVLGLNIMGLIPLFSTATANISVTLGLATVTLAFMIGGGICRNGFMGFLKSRGRSRTARAL